MAHTLRQRWKKKNHTKTPESTLENPEIPNQDASVPDLLAWHAISFLHFELIESSCVQTVSHTSSHNSVNYGKAGQRLGRGQMAGQVDATWQSQRATTCAQNSFQALHLVPVRECYLQFFRHKFEQIFDRMVSIWHQNGDVTQPLASWPPLSFFLSGPVCSVEHISFPTYLACTYSAEHTPLPLRVYSFSYFYYF